MTIREWIREREVMGIPAFSFEEVRHLFSSSSENTLKNDLYRQNLQKRILPVYRGFYVIIPPQMYGKRLNYVQLSSRHKAQVDKRDSRWKIYINTNIEADEL